MTKNILTLFLIIEITGLLFATEKSGIDQNQYCFRCHSMETLSYWESIPSGKDSASGMIVNLSVIPKEYYSSNHQELECIDCHSKDFQSFPHPVKLKDESLYCLNCHKDEDKFKQFNFPVIENAFKESVHYKKLGDKFTCFNCHDPHSFKIHARVDKEISETVLYDNQICLECHDNASKIKNISGEMIQDLNSSHSWLPHEDLHWKSVRCIDCHTSANAPGVSHLILPKEKAEKNCVSCHSANSKLMQSLYKFQSKESRSKDGFLNAVILNNSYVIGATRNYYLNLLSFIIFGVMIIALSVHGFLRLKSHKGKANAKK